MLDRRKAIVLYNKTDLSPAVTLSDIQKKTKKTVIPFSAKTGEGLDLLKNQIRELFYSGEISYLDETLITNLRHKEALEETLKSLELVLEGISAGMPEDFLSIDLRNACESLGKITGESLGEDLVNEIFSKFCMGK